MPETLKYTLKSDNKLMQITGYFEKNPVLVHDFTILHIELHPIIKFSKGIRYIMLNFTDESLNKVFFVN